MLRSRSQEAAKRALDIVGALILLGVTAPLIVVCALVIRVQDPGPAFFRQPRGGTDGRTFVVCKLRTMRLEADQVVVPCLFDDPGSRRAWEESRRSRLDPRVIHGVGSILRRTSLDELPQLWNIVRGDMSLVGPRPLELDVLETLPAALIRTRSTVRPGLTGLWQVSGRADLDLAQLLDLDVAYVANWSLWLDLRILMRTPAVVIAGRGAY